MIEAIAQDGNTLQTSNYLYIIILFRVTVVSINFHMVCDF